MAHSCCPPVALLRLALLAIVFFAPAATALPEAAADADSSSSVAASGPIVGVTSPGAANEILSRLENEGSGVPEDELEFYKRLYDFGVGKRAYSYVSEYKRLPVYNFGLGKRGGKQYGFGLGKRASGRQFSFGLGKRTPSDEEDYYYPDEEEEEVAEDDGMDELEGGVSKRDRLYSFGLGKRTRPFGFGLGKRGRQMYSFGLGKRGQNQQMYGFGLGKRSDGRLYSFGLGKRPNVDRMAGSRFNFGLGKRSDQETTDDLLRELSEDKRVPEHRFAFGLGKREVSPKDLEAVREEQAQNQDEKDNHEPNDASSNGKHAVKRSLHYGFGIGKRTSDAFDLDLEPEDEEREAVSEDFTRLIRRPYSFGLGKRVPLYDFGIGKRAE